MTFILRQEKVSCEEWFARYCLYHLSLHLPFKDHTD